MGCKCYFPQTKFRVIIHFFAFDQIRLEFIKQSTNYNAHICLIIIRLIFFCKLFIVNIHKIIYFVNCLKFIHPVIVVSFKRAVVIPSPFSLFIRHIWSIPDTVEFIYIKTKKEILLSLRSLKMASTNSSSLHTVPYRVNESKITSNNI